MIVFTQSELSTFRTCRKRWSFRYQDALSPRRRPRALSVGTIVHAGIAEAYRVLQKHTEQGCSRVAAARVCGESAMEGRIEAWRREVAAMEPSDHESEDLETEIALARVEATSAFGLYADAFLASDADEYEVLAVEQSFDVQIGDGRARAKMVGKIDLVLRGRVSRVIWLGEHKSTKGDASTLDSRVDVDGQVRAYLYALSVLYPDDAIGGVMLNVVRKQGPKQPKVNQKGDVSIAGCDTTRAVYVAALAEQEARGIPVTDKQRGFRDSLPESTARWVTRSEHVLGARDVNQWVSEALADARLMRATESASDKRRLPITRNPASCTLPWAPPCAYRSVCVDDTAGRRKAEYVVGERYSELQDETTTEPEGDE